MNDLLASIARRGYYWYLALKVGKVLSLPIWVFGWVLYALFGIIVLTIKGIITVAKDIAETIVSDFNQNVVQGHWFEGFSRKHYKSLDAYAESPVVGCTPTRIRK